MTNCPKCDSPYPHLHPAIQYEGEVQPCPDPFHEIVTASNTPQRIAELREFLARYAIRSAP
jgi:hypothetical protein